MTKQQESSPFTIVGNDLKRTMKGIFFASFFLPSLFSRKKTRFFPFRLHTVRHCAWPVNTFYFIRSIGTALKDPVLFYEQSDKSPDSGLRVDDSTSFPSPLP